MSSQGSESSQDSYSDAVSDPNLINFANGVYEVLCVDPNKWVAYNFITHSLLLNSGEDLIEKISSFSKGLGEKSLSLISFKGLFSSVTLSCPDVTLSLPDIKLESPKILHLGGVFESGKIVGDLRALVGYGDEEEIVANVVAGDPLIASESVKLDLASYFKRPRNLKRPRSDVEDPDTVKCYDPFDTEDFYNLSCVNRKEWIADHLLPHRLPVNNGEDVIEKISSISKGLGDRSLSVFSIWGLFSSVTLSRPHLIIESAKILRLRGVFESGKIVGDLSVRLHYDGGDIDDGIITAGPLIASESMELTLVSYLKRPRNLKRPRSDVEYYKSDTKSSVSKH